MFVEHKGIWLCLLAFLINVSTLQVLLSINSKILLNELTSQLNLTIKPFGTSNDLQQILCLLMLGHVITSEGKMKQCGA